MFGGVGKPAGWAAILVGSGVVLGGSISSAQAADLGGDCCADLEERVAELEATTARKGNRKVSLKISGWVNESVMWWNDGLESNVYEATNDLEQTRFRFTGDAKITNDLSAGYILEIGVDGVSSNALNQDISSGGSGLVIRKSAWYLKSKTYGQIAVGQNGTATYHVIDDADATNTRNFSDAQAATVQLHNYKIVVNGAYNGLKWSDLERGWNNQTPGQGDRKNIVRYNSPTFAGFAIAAAWGSDDLWDAALTYKADVGNFSVLAKVGYGESTDPSATKCGGPAPDFKCKWFGTGATIMHKPTGLYVYGGYGWQQIDTPTFAGDDTSTTWVIQPGIEKKFMPIGKTTIFGEFRHDDAGANPGACATYADAGRQPRLLGRWCRAEHRAGCDGPVPGLQARRGRIHR